VTDFCGHGGVKDRQDRSQVLNPPVTTGRSEQVVWPRLYSFSKNSLFVLVHLISSHRHSKDFFNLILC
jgi:hypothetical protein